jgi:peptide/nickel transport system permease protein
LTHGSGISRVIADIGRNDQVNRTEIFELGTRLKTASRWAFLKRLPLIPVLFLLPLIIFGIFGNFIAPHDPYLIQPALKLIPPVWTDGGNLTYLLGTDHMGRDVLSRIIVGARSTLIVSLCGVAVAGFIGVLLGMIGGYSQGLLDNLLMRITDMQMAIPPILLALLLSAVMHGGLTTIIIVIAVTFWAPYARVIRGETISFKQRDFVALARVAGCSSGRILAKHIFPNIISTITVLVTLQLGSAIMVESALTFLGVGLQPPAVAWGLMIADGRIYIATAWWIPIFAGLAIMITVLGANLLGDWLRDTLDPRLRQL